MPGAIEGDPPQTLGLRRRCRPMQPDRGSVDRRSNRREFMMRHYQCALLVRADLPRSPEVFLSVRDGRRNHVAHHAMVLAFATAARRQHRLGRCAHGEQRRKEGQQNCREQADGKQTAHGFRASVIMIAYASRGRLSLHLTSSASAVCTRAEQESPRRSFACPAADCSTHRRRASSCHPAADRAKQRCGPP